VERTSYLSSRAFSFSDAFTLGAMSDDADPSASEQQAAPAVAPLSRSLCTRSETRDWVSRGIDGSGLAGDSAIVKPAEWQRF